jgi:hypothetical protein
MVEDLLEEVSTLENQYKHFENPKFTILSLLLKNQSFQFNEIFFAFNIA